MHLRANCIKNKNNKIGEKKVFTFENKKKSVNESWMNCIAVVVVVFVAVAMTNATHIAYSKTNSHVITLN